jgi:GNAT superfamily N-acetyltransferase
MSRIEPPAHPLATMIGDAASGRYPAADGGWQLVPTWRPGTQAVVAFTGHAVLAVSPWVSEERLVALGIDGYGGAHHPRLVADLAGPDGWIDSLDALLVAGSGGEAEPLVERPDLASHPRAQFARRLRDDVRVFGYADQARSDLAVVSRGVAGLTELSVELEPGRRGRGAGSALVTAALATVPDDRLVVAAVAPGNAASLRTFLSAGFRPIASLQLFSPVEMTGISS